MERPQPDRQARGGGAGALAAWAGEPLPSGPARQSREAASSLGLGVRTSWVLILPVPMRVIRETKVIYMPGSPGPGVGDLWECRLVLGIGPFLSVFGGALCFLRSLGECVVLFPELTLRRVHLSLAVKTWGPMCPHFTDEGGSKLRLAGVRVGI